MNFSKLFVFVSLFAAVQAAASSPIRHAATPTEFAEALTTVATLRDYYQESLLATGTPPSSLHEIGFDETWAQTTLVSHVDIEPNANAILVGLSPKFGANAWVALTPTLDSFIITDWSCRTTVEAALVDDLNCVGGLSFEALTQIADASRLASAFASLALVRVNYAEYFQAMGRLPTSLKQINIDEPWLQESDFDHLLIEARRQGLLVGLSDVYGINQWISLTPRRNRNGELNWLCRTTLSSTLLSKISSEFDELRASGCRFDVAQEDLIR